MVLVGATALLQAGAAEAQDGRWEAGARFVAMTAGGEPANDMLGLGLVGRYRLVERWRLGFALDYSEFDFERPALIAGLPADFSAGDIDGDVTFTMVSAWIERVYGAGGAREWFWTAGLGGATLDVDPVTGPLQGGGTYTLSTHFDGELGADEVIVPLSAGLRLRIASRHALELALRADYHVADWEVVDEVSGATGRIDDYWARGGSVGWIVRF